jgi:hypothetical protein
LDGCEEVRRVAAVFLDEMAVDPGTDIDEREDIDSRVEVEILPGQHCDVEGVVREGLVTTLSVDEQSDGVGFCTRDADKTRPRGMAVEYAAVETKLYSAGGGKSTVPDFEADFYGKLVEERELSLGSGSRLRNARITWAY